MLADEDLAEDIHLHLQQLGKFITAEELLKYLHRPNVKLKHGIDQDISDTTARNYLHTLGYQFASQKKGQYSDGHERADVVYYQDHIYIPRLFTLLETSYFFQNDGILIIPPAGQHRTVIWYHDGIFYAHDHHRKTWYHKDCDAVPYRKGDGLSLMITDYFSADF